MHIAVHSNRTFNVIQKIYAPQYDKYVSAGFDRGNIVTTYAIKTKRICPKQISRTPKITEIAFTVIPTKNDFRQLRFIYFFINTAFIIGLMAMMWRVDMFWLTIFNQAISALTGSIDMTHRAIASEIFNIAFGIHNPIKTIAY